MKSVCVIALSVAILCGGCKSSVSPESLELSRSLMLIIPSDEPIEESAPVLYAKILDGYFTRSEIYDLHMILSDNVVLGLMRECAADETGDVYGNLVSRVNEIKTTGAFEKLTGAEFFFYTIIMTDAMLANGENVK